MAFTWRDWEKPQNLSIRRAGLHTKIWTRKLPRKKQECPHSCVTCFSYSLCTYECYTYYCSIMCKHNNITLYYNVVTVPLQVDSVELRLWTVITNGPIVHPPRDKREWKATVEWYWQGKNKELGEKSVPSALLCTTNPTWIDSGTNPDIRGKRPGTNHLNHETVVF
jgi:hypothetical protein